MLKRCIACLAIALYSVCAWAGFGPIHIYSRLGEPLRAEVPLLDTTSSDLQHWRVGLADRAAFDDLNLVYTPELADLRFSLRSGVDGPVVVIRSQHPVRTPYLQFVLQLRTLETRWVQGFYFKLEPLGGDVVESDPAAAPATKSAPSVQTLQVARGDTLAKLAGKIQPAGVRLEQAMAALVLANPGQFQPGEPPRPKPGAKLTVPWARTMRALSPARVRATLHPAAAKPLSRQEQIKPAEPLARREPIKPAERLPVEAPAPRVPEAKVVEPPKPASQPSAVKPPVNASQIAAYAASEAAAHAQITTLQKQVDARAQDLTKAQQHINQLNQKIKALQASEAATATLVANGFNYHNPRVLLAGGGALLLAGLFFLLGRRRRPDGKKKVAKSPSRSSLASTGVAQPDPHAAEAAGKGDPLAEAEVYLAYGHDDQAEAILVKALDAHPGRQDLRSKLLEIYAARPDLAQFERLAREVHDAYDGRGALWERTRAMGLAIDPDNPFYQADDVAAATSTPMMDFSALETPAEDEAALALPASPAEEPAAPAAAGDSLLDFDFSLEGSAAGAPEAASAETEAALALLDAAGEPALEVPEALASDEASLDWPQENVTDSETAVETQTAPLMSEMSQEAPIEAPSEEPIEAPIEAPPEAPAEAAPAAVTVEAIELPPSKDEEALATKLDLAQVYLDMGDSEGAREVLGELIREARGQLKQRAEAMLAQVG